MSHSSCLGFLSFIPLDPKTPKIFGFSEFLAGLALMVLAWTLGDVRYRFRVRTAPFPLQGLSFAVVAAIGVLALLTDLWRAQGWLVPRGNIISSLEWQVLLGGLFLLTVLAWAWFAFIRPPVFSRWNAKRYARSLYRIILKGSPDELAIIADELTRSARSLIRYATIDSSDSRGGGPYPRDQRIVARLADEILLLIADKRFCRAIVSSSPGTALSVFHEIEVTRKYGCRVEIFGKNIVQEALANKDSFLFHEAEGYDSGLLGYHKPLSQAMFGNYDLVEVVGTLLDSPYPGDKQWDAAQWNAYCRVALMTFRDWTAKRGVWDHSFVIVRAMNHIETAISDLYRINGVASFAWDDDVQGRLRAVVDFIEGAIELLEKKGAPEALQLRIRGEQRMRTIYDHLANLIVEVIFQASQVRSPFDLCWWVQRNAVWGEIFNFRKFPGPVAKIVKFKVRRLLYDEVDRMTSTPNFRGARILGFCLNVMGFDLKDKRYTTDSRALQKAVLSWTKKHFAKLHANTPQLAKECLVDGFAYQAGRLRLVRTYPQGTSPKPRREFFTVDP